LLHDDHDGRSLTEGVAADSALQRPHAARLMPCQRPNLLQLVSGAAFALMTATLQLLALRRRLDQSVARQMDCTGNATRMHIRLCCLREVEGLKG